MQALQKRQIKPGHEYDRLFPKSSRQDIVIRESGKAKLHHTINLIKDLVHETREDTKLLAAMLKGENLEESCQNIWEFVYNYINYRRDKAGIEQVRRPSRSWADRKQGVDCDCYTVFISSILTNLAIPHNIRITKYGGKRHFQHIYPVVLIDSGSNPKPLNPDYITIDCVTDHFNYEVPFSDYRDFSMDSRRPVGEIGSLSLTTVSGVDSADLLCEALGVFSLKQPTLPLREIVKSADEGNTAPSRITIKPLQKQKETARIFVSLVAQNPETSNEEQPSVQPKILPKQDRQASQSISGLWIKVLIAAGVGFGAYKLLGS